MPGRRKDDSRILVCFQTFTTANVRGQPVIQAGTRLRADNPLVQAAPHYWAEDGATDEELNALRTHHRQLAYPPGDDGKPSSYDRENWRGNADLRDVWVGLILTQGPDPD
jgi:hypothetical protein